MRAAHGRAGRHRPGAYLPSSQPQPQPAPPPPPNTARRVPSLKRALLNRGCVWAGRQVTEREQVALRYLRKSYPALRPAMRARTMRVMHMPFWAGSMSHAVSTVLAAPSPSKPAGQWWSVMCVESPNAVALVRVSSPPPSPCTPTQTHTSLCSLLRVPSHRDDVTRGCWLLVTISTTRDLTPTLELPYVGLSAGDHTRVFFLF